VPILFQPLPILQVGRIPVCLRAQHAGSSRVRRRDRRREERELFCFHDGRSAFSRELANWALS
jgi:hypothetical protein